MAHAVVTSLMTTLEQVLQFNPTLVSENREPVDSLYGKLSFLQAFFEDMGNRINDQEVLTFLEKKIRNAVYKAEDSVDLCLRRIHVADTDNNQNAACRKLYDELQQITKVMDCIQEEVMKFKNDNQDIVDPPPTIHLPLRSSGPVLDEENTFVGMEDDFNIIRDQLIRKERWLNIVSIVEEMEIQRRLCLHPDALQNWYLGMEKANLDSVHTMLYLRESHTSKFDHQCYDIVNSHFQNLRVLDIESIPFSNFPSAIPQLVHLRYVACNTGKDVPASISNLWNLQTFIVHPFGSQLSLPLEIWNMSSLRHLYPGGMYMPPPKAQNFLGLENLETLDSISVANSNWKEIFAAIPKVKNQAAATSAEEILQEQQSLGNEVLVVRAYNTGGEI
ncbi:hypothetical protein K7X08_031462 [Anisodus acutangulus]|uniref:Disease resistance N-terminal domain-containing protein n=1 Tax=Anisodus acutangulus TaxID=402998 RepID=A0A9Q1ML44_9SOLA|nr:hypothetical protein K7X08_031462 [Anisodus acutangulus]